MNQGKTMISFFFVPIGDDVQWSHGPLHNENAVYNMTIHSEMMWRVHIIPTMLNHTSCLCSYFFGHILWCFYRSSVFVVINPTSASKNKALAPPWTLFLKTHINKERIFFVILMHLMCIPQKGRIFCDIFTSDASISEGASFISAEGFLNWIFYANISFMKSFQAKFVSTGSRYI